MTVRNLGSNLFYLVTVPFFAVVFIAIVEQSGRSSLIAYAVMAPVLIALWQMAIFVAGELINRDRWRACSRLSSPRRRPLRS